MEEPRKFYNVDYVLDQFSIFGRYHLEVMVLALVAFVTNSVYCANYVFATESVGYRCKERYDNTTQSAAVNDTASRCAEWEYEDPNSFVAEFGLAGQEWQRTLVGTAHSAGYMAGLLIVGPVSDRFGRKTAVVMTGMFGGIFGLVRSLSPWYWFYITMEFLEAATGDICSPMYVLEMEIVSARNKINFNMFCNMGYVIGAIIVSIIAWLVPYWRTFLQIIYLPALLFFLYQYLLDESPRWLIMRGKKDEAITILQKAAKKNNLTLDKNVLDNLSCEAMEGTSFLGLLARTFKSSTLRLRFFVCLIWWNTSTFVHYGMVINSVSLPGNKYVNFALTSVMRGPAILVITYVMVHCKRRLPLMVSFILGGLLCLIQPIVPVDLPWLSITFYMLGKIVSFMYFSITYVYTMELFPTSTRNSMHALCSSLGRIGSVVAPQTPLLLPIWSGLPTVTFGLSAVIAGLTTLLVPDVSNDALPDTVQQAEALGKLKSPVTSKKSNMEFEVSKL